MGILDWIGSKRSRDKPHNSYEGQDFPISLDGRPVVKP